MAATSWCTIYAVTDWAEQLDGLQAGEAAAANQIITLVTRYLARIGAFEMRDSWDDFVQEVLITLIQKPPTSREPGAIVRHIQTTCRRLYIDEIRRTQGRKRTKRGDEDAGTGWRRNVSFDEAQEPGLADQFWSGQMDLGVRAALDRLEERTRRVVEAVYLEGFTYEEASSQLSIPLGTLKGVLRDGLSTLRQQILGEGKKSPSDSRGSSVSSSEALPRTPVSRGGMKE
jgi:RNA polymerase sigma factor (sigma-70 family)